MLGAIPLFKCKEYEVFMSKRCLILRAEKFDVEIRRVLDVKNPQVLDDVFDFTAKYGTQDVLFREEVKNANSEKAFYDHAYAVADRYYSSTASSQNAELLEDVFKIKNLRDSELTSTRISKETRELQIKLQKTVDERVKKNAFRRAYEIILAMKDSLGRKNGAS